MKSISLKAVPQQKYCLLWYLPHLLPCFIPLELDVTGAGGKQLLASPSEHLSGRGSQTLPAAVSPLYTASVGCCLPSFIQEKPQITAIQSPKPLFFAESSPPDLGAPQSTPLPPGPPKEPL